MSSSNLNPPARLAALSALLGALVAVVALAFAGPAAAQHEPGGPGSTQAQKIVGMAQALEEGDAARYWHGGKIPYSWGAGHGAHPGPSYGTCQGSDCSAEKRIGLDCSGFSRYVYFLAYGDKDVLGATSSQGQKDELVRDSSAHAGDLVFFGGSSSIHHVGVYIGGGHMIDEYGTGYVVRTDPIFSDVYGYYHL